MKEKKKVHTGLPIRAHLGPSPKQQLVSGTDVTQIRYVSGKDLGKAAQATETDCLEL